MGLREFFELISSPVSKLKEKISATEWGAVEIVNKLSTDQKYDIEIMKEKIIEEPQTEVIKPHSLNYYILLAFGNAIEFDLKRLPKEKPKSIVEIQNLIESQFPEINLPQSVIEFQKYLHTLALATLLSETSEEIAVSEVNKTFKIYKYKITTNGVLIAKWLDISLKIKTLYPEIHINLKEVKKDE